MTIIAEAIAQILALVVLQTLFGRPVGSRSPNSRPNLR